jgi:dihydrofolate reductase
MVVTIIVAMGEDRVIGIDGHLPWHLPEDLKRFKARTKGHTLVMGRRTFESLGGKPLPGRPHFVVSRHPQSSTTDSVKWFKSVEEAVAAAQQAGESECFIAGGTAIFAEGLKIADWMYFTFVHRPGIKGDTYFPAWDQKQWRAVKRETVGEAEFVDYERAGPKE